MLWYLWSQNRQEIPKGVYSHNTALSLHELSDLMPSKLHMTAPKELSTQQRDSGDSGASQGASRE